MDPSYQALLDKVDAFHRETGERRRGELACREGCDGCCRVLLSVSAVEAEAVRAGLAQLPAEARRRVAERARRASPEAPRCPMLDERGACSIYPWRPLVCRTQGLALRYPAGVIPAETVRGHAGEAEVTWCPLNFVTSSPRAEDVLDAERVDQLLALINHRRAAGRGEDPHTRTPLTRLAIDADGESEGEGAQRP